MGVYAPNAVGNRGNGAGADLAGHECLSFAHWSGALARRWQLTRGGHRFDAEVSRRLQVNGAVLRRAALDGNGIPLGAEAAV